MKESFMLVLSVVLEYFILLYYVCSFRERRLFGLGSGLPIAGVYVIYAAICIFVNLPICNIACFAVSNFIAMRMEFDESVRMSAMRTVLFSMLNMLGEFIMLVIMSKDFFGEEFGLADDVVYTISSKLFYFVGVVIYKRLTANRKNRSDFNEIIMFVPFPIATCLVFYIFDSIKLRLDFNGEIKLLILGAILIISNYVLCVVYDRLEDGHAAMLELKSREQKEAVDYEHYKLIREKYDAMRMMAHNLNKYCSSMEKLILEDKSAAKSMIREMRGIGREFEAAAYTNNSVLNIILSQKVRECNTENIDFNIKIRDVDFSFIGELDTVAIFSNILDNAIESCKKINDGKISLNAYSLNEACVAICTDNSAQPPKVTPDGRLETTKSDSGNHGMGVAIIEETLKKYSGRFQWSYDTEEGVFSTAVIMNIKRS